MLRRIRIDVIAFYEIARRSLEEASDAEYEHIEGLFRSISALRRLIEQGQATIVIPTESWGAIANAIENEANQIDNFRQSRLINNNHHAGNCDNLLTA